MWPLLLYLGLPPLLAIVFWRAERAALTRKRDLLLRAPTAASDGVELRVRVEEGSGQRVSLGSSVETPESVSATPTLTTAEVVLVEQAFDEADGPAPEHVRPGRRLALKPGASMVIAGLPGARRKPLDIETTDTGVVHHYSFELAPDKTFWISGVLESPDPGGPFRGDGTWQLAPLAGAAKSAYVASATRGARERKNEEASLGLGGALFFAGVGSAVAFIPYAGPVLWFLLVAAMILVTLGELGSARPKPPTVAPAAPPTTPRVRLAIPAVDEAATDEEAEHEAAAEELAQKPPAKSWRA